MPEIITKNGA